MKRSQHALWRLYWIDAVLQRDARPTAGRLATDLAVSRGTIHRDLARLRDEFKAPVIFDPSIGGFLYTQPFCPALPDLPAEETLELGAALMRHGPLEQTALGTALQQLLESLLQLLPGHRPEAAGALAGSPRPGRGRRTTGLRPARRRLGDAGGAQRETREAEVTLLLRFDGVAAPALLAEGYLRREEVQFLTDGGLETTLTTSDPDALLLDLLRWAPHFEIVSPAWVRRRLPNLLRRLLRLSQARKRRRPAVSARPQA